MLAVAFGARLSYLQPPAFARIALLALPEKQLPGPALDVGFLVEFRSYLTRQVRLTIVPFFCFADGFLCQAAASSYDDSRDEAIVQMTELLQQHMQQQSWISMVKICLVGWFF